MKAEACAKRGRDDKVYEYEGKEGHCRRADDYPVKPDDKGTLADVSAECNCKAKCDDDSYCAAYEFNSSSKRCDHWFTDAKGDR